MDEPVRGNGLIHIRLLHPFGTPLAVPFCWPGSNSKCDGLEPSSAWTAGAVISTLHDLKIWTKALATGQLLSATTQKERLTWSICAPRWLGNPQCYGLGIIDFNGFLGHDGQIPGYTSWLGYQPQNGATIIVLSNLYQGSDGSSPAVDLAEVIYQELFA